MNSISDADAGTQHREHRGRVSRKVTPGRRYVDKNSDRIPTTNKWHVASLPYLGSEPPPVCLGYSPASSHPKSIENEPKGRIESAQLSLSLLDIGRRLRFNGVSIFCCPSSVTPRRRLDTDGTYAKQSICRWVSAVLLPQAKGLAAAKSLKIERAGRIAR